MKRILGLILVTALLLTAGAGACAEERGTRASDLIFSYTISSSANSNGNVSFTANVSGYGTVDKIGFSNVYI